MITNSPNTVGKFGLAIHTTSTDFGLAIGNFQEQIPNIRQGIWDLGQDLSKYLHSYLQDFLPPQNWSDFAFLAVAQGPGGFTGSRLGIVTARTLAQQLNIPLYGISSLMAMAVFLWQKNHDVQLFQPSTANTPPNNIHLAVEMPANRGQLFTAIYGFQFGENGEFVGMQTLLADQVMSPDVWQNTLSNWQNNYELITLTGGLGVSAVTVLQLGYLAWQINPQADWSTVLPFYGQHPVN
jgi:tRNA threonylcarbamoyl adenosine modification protein YeaZ